MNVLFYSSNLNNSDCLFQKIIFSFSKSYEAVCLSIHIQSYIIIRDVGIDLEMTIFFYFAPIESHFSQPTQPLAVEGTMTSEKWLSTVGRVVATSEGGLFRRWAVMPEKESAPENPFDGSALDLHYKNQSIRALLVWLQVASVALLS